MLPILQLQDNNALTSVSLPALASVGADLQVGTLVWFASIRMRVTYYFIILQIYYNTNLTSVNLPVLAFLDGNLYVSTFL